jgi:hypothetical protein
MHIRHRFKSTKKGQNNKTTKKNFAFQDGAIPAVARAPFGTCPRSFSPSVLGCIISRSLVFLSGWFFSALGSRWNKVGMGQAAYKGTEDDFHKTTTDFDGIYPGYGQTDI